MQSPRTVRVFAPAKVNLTLHVTGRRPDGYHLLDSLVAFASVGDWLTFERSDRLTLRIDGPKAAGVPQGSDNLVLRAAAVVSAADTAAISLEKHLPAAAGIGGGSADAGATIRGLSRMWSRQIPGSDVLAGIGADVPVCVLSAPARMRGVGEDVSRVPGLPEVHAVLVNPGVAVETAAVFRSLNSRSNSPMPDILPGFRGAVDLADFLRSQRNDLEPAVAEALPKVAETLGMLRGTRGALLARMSGSGATCFALFETESEAQAAAAQLQRPDWWVSACRLFSDEGPSAPQVLS